MAYTREIVTLQVGHYSNFIGTHWWNLQDASFVFDERAQTDINHDVLFREGQTRNREQTFLPRLVVVDLKGSLNTLREEGILYSEPLKSNRVTWKGKTSIHKTEPSRKNEFLRDLEKEEIRSSPGLKFNVDPEKDICQASCSNTVCVDDEPDASGTRSKFYDLNLKVDLWSDFLRMHFHPRSIFLLDQYNHGNSVEPFSYFGLGQGVWNNVKTAEAIEDKIRFFAEECNNLQGFHLLVDSHNGFSGLGVGIASYLQDEFDTKTILSFPSQPVTENKPNENQMNVLSAAYSLGRLSSTSSVVVPASLLSNIQNSENTRKFPYLNYDANLPYHSSAIIASALDTITLLYRLRSRPVLISDFTKNLVYRGMKVAGLSVSLPFPTSENRMKSSLNFCDKQNVQSLTFGCELTKIPNLLQTICVRGISDVSINSLASTSQRGSNFTTKEEIMENIFRKLCPSKFSIVKEVLDPCHTIGPFPNIFSPQITKDGIIDVLKTRPENVGVTQVPMASGIHCTPEIGKMLQSLIDNGKKINARRLQGVLTHFELDDFTEMIESLQSLSENYKDLKDLL